MRTSVYNSTGVINLGGDLEKRHARLPLPPSEPLSSRERRTRYRNASGKLHHPVALDNNARLFLFFPCVPPGTAQSSAARVGLRRTLHRAALECTFFFSSPRQNVDMHRLVLSDITDAGTANKAATQRN